MEIDSRLFLNSGVEQMVARVAHNHKVTGSSPVPATKLNKGLGFTSANGCGSNHNRDWWDASDNSQGNRAKEHLFGVGLPLHHNSTKVFMFNKEVSGREPYVIGKAHFLNDFHS